MATKVTVRTWSPHRVHDVTKKRFLAALKKMSVEMEDEIKGRMKQLYPPASRPGKPPAARSGRLLRSIRLISTTEGLDVRTAPHGRYLEEGTDTMRPRPFIQPALFTSRMRRQWEARLAKLIRGGK